MVYYFSKSLLSTLTNTRLKGDVKWCKESRQLCQHAKIPQQCWEYGAPSEYKWPNTCCCQMQGRLPRQTALSSSCIQSVRFGACPTCSSRPRVASQTEPYLDWGLLMILPVPWNTQSRGPNKIHSTHSVWQNPNHTVNTSPRGYVA